MIGVSIVLGKNSGLVNNLDTLKEEWHFNKYVIESKELIVSYTGYNGYPIDSWQYKDYYVIVEGIIYNYEEEELHSKLNTLVDRGCHNEDITELIHGADGDYCVYIVSSLNKTVLAFNDILGGMPLFYSNEDDTFFISRRFDFIATNLRCRKWKNENIAEFLKFGYNLRKRTFSDGINKIEPASIVRASFSNRLEYKYENLYVDDFSLTNQYKSKEEAVKDLATLFFESCRRRVKYANTHGYTIVNTLSGGFDSRTIVGGIEPFTDGKYINLTYEYKQDESAIAKEVLKAIDSKSEYVKLDFKNKPDYYDIRLTKNTDGRINVFTNSICYHDMLSVRGHFGDERIMYFGGFGGEFIRHPRYETITPFFKVDRFTPPTYKMVSSICKTRVKDMLALFTGSFVNKGKTHESNYKDWYNEYYQNLVRCSGEDRMRMFYFTVQPMMNKEFIMAIRHRVPLKWVGFEFYKNFLKAVDERLVKVDIFNKSSSYLNDSNLRRIDFCRRYGADFIGPCKIIRSIRNKDKTIEYSAICEYLNNLGGLKLFDEEFLSDNYQKFDKELKFSLIAIISYIYAIEQSINSITRCGDR